MKYKKYLSFLVIVLLYSHKGFSEQVYSELVGPYMGQSLPGLTAELFAPGVISTTEWEVEGGFAPGMNEFYYVKNSGTTNRPVTIGLRRVDNKWEQFVELKRAGEVTFSQSGDRMYMAKGYRERSESGWSRLQSLGPLINMKDYGIMRLSASNKDTYVFDDYRTDKIRISTIENGERTLPTFMNDDINTGKWTAHPYIAPDESYLIWDSERPEGYGSTDLYISFRKENGKWGKAINMGKGVNSERGEMLANVTPDGRFIMFNRKAELEGDNWDIYWVDAGIIEQLRPR